VAPATTPPVMRVGDIYPRLLSRYMATEAARNTRDIRPNLFSMLYTPPPVVPVTGGGGGNIGSRPGAPTSEQIRRGTSTTVFRNIISPVNATCPISRDEFNDTSEVTMIRGCNHIFNRDSLREWFISHSTCPLCRYDIRDYRASWSPLPTQPSSLPMNNVRVDSIDDDHITFSYELPPLNYSEDQLYREIVNTIVGMTTGSSANAGRGLGNGNGDGNGDGNGNGNGNDDIMNVD